MASWKLYWLSLLPFVLLLAYIAATNDLSDETSDQAGPFDIAVTWIAVLASVGLWGWACVALARERFSSTISIMLTVGFSFFLPVIWVIVFLSAPNRRRRRPDSA